MSFRLPTRPPFKGDFPFAWRKYFQEFLIYLEAAGLSEVSSTRKVAILLNALGNEGIYIYEHVLKLEKKKCKDFDCVVKAFMDHLCRKYKAVVSKRYLFNTYSQGNESFETFLRNIVKLAAKCEFGDQKEAMLVDRVICGVKDDKLRECLLQCDEPTLSNFIQIIQCKKGFSQSFSRDKINRLKISPSNSSEDVFFNAENCKCEEENITGKCGGIADIVIDHEKESTTITSDRTCKGKMNRICDRLEKTNNKFCYNGVKTKSYKEGLLSTRKGTGRKRKKGRNVYEEEININGNSSNRKVCCEESSETCWKHGERDESLEKKYKDEFEEGKGNHHFKLGVATMKGDLFKTEDSNNAGLLEIDKGKQNKELPETLEVQKNKKQNVIDDLPKTSGGKKDRNLIEAKKEEENKNLLKNLREKNNKEQKESKYLLTNGGVKKNDCFVAEGDRNEASTGTEEKKQNKDLLPKSTEKKSDEKINANLLKTGKEKSHNSFEVAEEKQESTINNEEGKQNQDLPKSIPKRSDEEKKNEVSLNTVGKEESGSNMEAIRKKEDESSTETVEQSKVIPKSGEKKNDGEGKKNKGSLKIGEKEEGENSFENLEEKGENSTQTKNQDLKNAEIISYMEKHKNKEPLKGGKEGGESSFDASAKEKDGIFRETKKQQQSKDLFKSIRRKNYEEKDNKDLLIIGEKEKGESSLEIPEENKDDKSEAGKEKDEDKFVVEKGKDNNFDSNEGRKEDKDAPKVDQGKTKIATEKSDQEGKKDRNDKLSEIEEGSIDENSSEDLLEEEKLDVKWKDRKEGQMRIEDGVQITLLEKGKTMVSVTNNGDIVVLRSGKMLERLAWLRKKRPWYLESDMDGEYLVVTCLEDERYFTCFRLAPESTEVLSLVGFLYVRDDTSLVMVTKPTQSSDGISTGYICRGLIGDNIIISGKEKVFGWSLSKKTMSLELSEVQKLFLTHSSLFVRRDWQLTVLKPTGESRFSLDFNKKIKAFYENKEYIACTVAHNENLMTLVWTKDGVLVEELTNYSAKGFHPHRPWMLCTQGELKISLWNITERSVIWTRLVADSAHLGLVSPSLLLVTSITEGHATMLDFGTGEPVRKLYEDKMMSVLVNNNVVCFWTSEPLGITVLYV